MRSRWEALRAGLMQSIETREARGAFAAMQGRTPALAGFAEPTAVVAYLNQDGGDRGEKNRVLAALIHAQRGPDTRGPALALLFLGLWPGLEGIRRRRLWLFADAPHDLEADLVDSLAAHVERVNLRKVGRIAGTLVRSTERDVVDTRMKYLRERARSVEVSPDVAAASPDVANPSPFGLPPDVSDDDAVAVLRAWLEGAVGQDADLVVAAVVLGRNQRELAHALGLSHATTRKRVQRALRRARELLILGDLMSHERSGAAFDGR